MVFRGGYGVFRGGQGVYKGGYREFVLDTMLYYWETDRSGAIGG